MPATTTFYLQRMIWIRAPNCKTPALLCHSSQAIVAYTTATMETFITLSFLPGNHSLAVELSMVAARNISMITANFNVHGDDTALVSCSNQSGRFSIRNSTFVQIKDLHFIGCGGNEIIQVERFILENATFHGVSWSSSLVLHRVANGIIVKNSFILNSNSNLFHHEHGAALCINDSSFSIVDGNFTRNSASSEGGVVYALNSTFNISTSYFADNVALKGGVIYSCASVFSITGSTFINNSATYYGGVLCIDNSSFVISTSIFTNNRASMYGGVVAVLDKYTSGSASLFSISNSSFVSNNATNLGGVLYTRNNSIYSISSSNFTKNKACKGGVIYAHASFFNISHNNFINNTALCYWSSFYSMKGTGGVMYANHSLFSIGFSIFIRNKAESEGGVLHVEHNTQFDIFASNFTHNSASDNGGVMNILWSSYTCNITASNFIKNDASYSGGVIFTRDSRIGIVSSIFVENSAKNDGGVLLTCDSSFSISISNFTHNRAGHKGGIVILWQSELSIINSSFMENNASHSGGAIRVDQKSSLSIAVSNFTNNRASRFGGAILFKEASTFNITDTGFTENRASYSGGALYVQGQSSGAITSSKFIKNYAAYGAVLFLNIRSSLHILTSTFDYNSDNSMLDKRDNENSTTCTGKLIAEVIDTKCSIYRGIIAALIGSLFNITSSKFTSNHATLGVITAFMSNFSITNSIYVNNTARIGGVISTFNASFRIINSFFSKNHAEQFGGVACIFESPFDIFHSNFTDNKAILNGGVIYIVSTRQHFNVTIADSTFSNNEAKYGGIMYITGTKVDVINGTFYQNSGSFYAFSSNITFRGTTRFENCAEPSLNHNSELSRKEGGAITSYHSSVTFTGETILLNNQARDGGAIVAIDGDIIVWDETLISSNNATSYSGGGIYLIQCDLYIHGRCNFTQNHASMRGGGVYASGSAIVVQPQGYLSFTNNSAENGGGIYLRRNSRLVTVSKFPGILNDEGENGFVKFIDNNAKNGSGGAIYMADENSVSCFSIECLIQSVAFNKLLSNAAGTDIRLILFSGNTATHYGSNIFGGLFDRCTPSPFATIYTDESTSQYYSGIDYLQTISNIALNSIASDPVRVCFCNNTGQPDCTYETFTIKVKKGQNFSISIAAVDQVNRSVNASIRSMLINNSHGRMGEGQQQQKISGENCTKLTYSVYSPNDSEIISLFADGPCKTSVLSRRNVSIQFLNCTCSIGFEPSCSYSECTCICSWTLSPYITKCDPATNSVFRANTTSWISYINDTDPPGFMIHPICPLDYCYLPSENVSINFNLSSGSDAQCAHNHSGILCGACQLSLSLSLGSSRCLPCPNHWPLVFISIMFAALVAGILIVTVILVLNMTVADGMINAIIFYTDVTAPFHRIVHSSASPNFPTVFIAWLNLDIGFDVCFVKGLDAYAKTWIHLLFPAYIIFLVAMVIQISKHSPRFTRLISCSRRRDPVATLATLILLSYAKLLSTTISVLSYAILTYPDGSTSVVWLVDGSVQFLRGKHIALVIAVAIIILIGVPYTFILLFWQWLIQIPKINLNRWTRLNSIITPYHAPYNNRHRYWSGLLLLVRVVLYITVSVTVSSNPQIPLLMTVVLVGGLFFLKGIIGTSLSLYKRSSVDIVETVILLNLLLFAAFSWYNFKLDNRKETAIMYVSTGTVFLLLLGEIAYKVISSTGILGCIKGKTSADNAVHNQLLVPLIRSPSLSSEVTHSSIEISLPTPSPNEHGRNDHDFENEKESSFIMQNVG